MIDGLLSGLKNVIGLLPDLDLAKFFRFDKLQEYMGYINWCVPFGTIAKIETAWFACIGLYFGYLTMKPLIMKWLKTLI